MDKTADAAAGAPALIRHCSYSESDARPGSSLHRKRIPAQEEGSSISSRRRLREADLEKPVHDHGKVWIQSLMSSLSPDILIVDGHPEGSMRELGKALQYAKKKILIQSEEELSLSDVAVPTEGNLISQYNRRIQAASNSPILIREREELLSRKKARKALGIESERAVYVTLRGRESDGGTRSSQGGSAPQVGRRHVVIGAGPGCEALHPRERE